MSDYIARLKKEPHFWNETIEKATGRAFDWRCPFCGVDLGDVGYIKAHISPVGTGIGYTPGNIVLTCNDCNVSMHNTHAWEWCARNKVSYWWMIPILETLQKVFSVAVSDPFPVYTTQELPPQKYSRPAPPPSMKMELAKKWLTEHPEDLVLVGRQLEENVRPEGVMISYRTWNKAKALLSGKPLRKRKKRKYVRKQALEQVS